LHPFTGVRLSYSRLFELVRAGAAGILATGADLMVLALLVSVLHWDARAASIPALVAGGVVNFVGNRHFAFGAARGPFVRQAVGYTAVELIALALNGVFYDAVMRAFPSAAQVYWAVRLATSHLVFFAWSYPLWRRVFSAPHAASCTQREARPT
jgi:putative flippase GtrA